MHTHLSGVQVDAVAIAPHLDLLQSQVDRVYRSMKASLSHSGDDGVGDPQNGYASDNRCAAQP